MKKKIYENPTMEVHKLENCVCLLQASKLDGENPFDLDDPGNDDR